MTQKGQGRDPNIFGAHYLDNGWRFWDSNGHVTQKGEGHGPKIFGASWPQDIWGPSPWRYGVGANRAPIGNDYWVLNGHVNDDVE